MAKRSEIGRKKYLQQKTRHNLFKQFRTNSLKTHNDFR